MQSIIAEDQMFSKKESTIFAEVGDEVVLMGDEDGEFFGLNPVAADLWAQLEAKPASLSDMVHYLMNKYEITKDTAHHDVKAFIQDMLEADFIESHAAA